MVGGIMKMHEQLSHMFVSCKNPCWDHGRCLNTQSGGLRTHTV